MCGIVAVKIIAGDTTQTQIGNNLFENLLTLSASRGKDSAGAAVFDANSIYIYKEALPVKKFIKTEGFSLLKKRSLASTSGFLALGHSRMETHGSFQQPENNQPIIRGNTAVLHNGIITNYKELWAENPEQSPQTDVDSEILALYLDESIKQHRNIVKACNDLTSKLTKVKGSFSFLAFSERLNGIVVATNTGSLYIAQTQEGLSGSFLIASEKRFLVETITSYKLEGYSISQLPINSVQFFGLGDEQVNPCRKIEVLKSAFSSKRPRANNVGNTSEIERQLSKAFELAKKWKRGLKHCSKCILPETMPFIHFDSKGVCNYCNRYSPRQVLGKEALLNVVESWRSKVGDPECVVSFSGGRDSSYALHLVKKELKLKPVAFSYDWGMLTDLGRRNQARMTGSLGVEHILVAADIQKKRENIRKNVAAWLKSPSLGIVPLFMAGDKHYFYHLNQVCKKMGIKHIVYGDNSLEKSDFKYGFANVANNAIEKKSYHIGFLNSLKLLGFYGSQFLSNPAYINSSVFNTLSAYWSSYFEPKNFLHLFKFFLWDEGKIETTLLNDYGWELATDSRTSWRIGDGTAGFYNYVYFILSGLSEIDTFKSNQIREGLISREDAMQSAEQANSPRNESIIWYFDTIGLDALEAIKIINLESQKYIKNFFQQVSQR
jgi:glucosamine--fructose-6-phosphate aminotransferase (isomerizing)